MKFVTDIKVALTQRQANLSSSFFTYLVSAVINLLATYAMMVWLLNVLSKDAYGEYAIYISLFSMLLIFANFGHKEVMFKYASLNKAQPERNLILRVFNTFCYWNLLLFICVQLLLFINITIYAVAMMFLANSWLITLAAAYRGNADYTKDAWVIPLQRVLWLFISICCYYLMVDFNLVTLFFSALLAISICVGWLYWPLSKAGVINLKNGFMRSKQDSRHLRLLVSYLMIEICSVFYLKSDVLLLRWFDVELAVMANYFFAIQVFEIAVMVLMPVGYFYLNGLNQMKHKQKGLSLIRPVLIIILLMVVIMHGTVAILAPLVFPWMVPKYVDSIGVILLVMCTLYPVSINILLSTQLIAQSKELSYAKICFIGLLFNLLANYFLIPKLGLEGAIVVKFMTELLIMSLLLFLSKYKGGSNLDDNYSTI